MILAIKYAKEAFPEWSTKTVRERSQLLSAVADRMESKLEELAHLESIDTGKPLSLSRTVDIPRAIANFRFFAGQILFDSTDCFEVSGASLTV